MKKYYVFVLLIAVISWNIVGCVGNQTVEQPTEPTTLKIAWINWPGYYPLILGVKQGFFEKRGLNIEVVEVDDQVQAFSSLVIGKMDGLCDTLGNIVLLESEHAGKAQLIFPVNHSDGGDAFLAPTDIKTPADLEGQTVSLLAAPFSSVFATVMLDDYGLSLQSVNQTQHVLKRGLTLLDDGKAQAVHVYEPFVSEGIEKGYHVIYSSKDTPNLIVDGITFRTQVIEEDPDSVQAFVDGWFEALDWWQANPEEGNAMLAEYLDIPVEEVSVEGVTILDREAALNLFGPNPTESTLHQTAQFYSDTMIELGFLTAEPVIDTLINGSFLE